MDEYASLLAEQTDMTEQHIIVNNDDTTGHPSNSRIHNRLPAKQLHSNPDVQVLVLE
jgi:hypothetical protein